MVEAEPLTGKTHQIRVHAAESGFPILGDTLYGGTPAARVFLHAAEISFTHPATGKPVTFRAPANFDADFTVWWDELPREPERSMFPAARREVSPHLLDSAPGAARRFD